MHLYKTGPLGYRAIGSVGASSLQPGAACWDASGLAGVHTGSTPLYLDAMGSGVFHQQYFLLSAVSYYYSPPALPVFTLFTGDPSKKNASRDRLQPQFQLQKDHHRTLLCAMLKRSSDEVGPSH